MVAVYQVLEWPLGRLTAVMTNKGLGVLGFGEPTVESLSEWDSKLAAGGLVEGTVSTEVREALDAYFRRDFAALDRLEIDLHGTPFQVRTWEELRKVPAGKTVSYVELAKAIGSPGASRAVGAANAANPVVIVIPCHRVIRADGGLSGYGGGVEKKEWLLRHEWSTEQPFPLRLCANSAAVT